MKVKTCNITEIEGFRRRLNFINEDVKRIGVHATGNERNSILVLQPSTREGPWRGGIHIQLTFWTI